MARTTHPDRPRAKNLQPLKYGLPFLKPYKLRIFLALVFLTLASLSMLGMPISIRYVIDYGFSADNAAYIDRYFMALLALALAFGLGGKDVAAEYLKRWLEHKKA